MRNLTQIQQQDWIHAYSNNIDLLKDGNVDWKQDFIADVW